MAYEEDEFPLVGDGDLAAEYAGVAWQLVSEGDAVLAAPEVVLHLQHGLLSARGEPPHLDVLVTRSVGKEAVFAERAERDIASPNMAVFYLRDKLDTAALYLVKLDCAAVGALHHDCEMAVVFAEANLH